MKNFLYRSVWTFFTTIMLVGCSNDLEQNFNNDFSEVAISAVSMGNTNSSTRTQVGEVVDGRLNMQWAPNEKIGVFGTTSNNIEFTSTNTSPANKATFTGKMLDGELPLVAYYPYEEGVVNSAAIPLTIPNKQVYKDEQSIANYDFKAAVSCSPDNDGTYHMTFRQMATILRLQIEIEGVTGLSANERVQSIEIDVDGYDLSGFYTYDLNNLDRGLNREPEQGTDLYTRVSIEMANKPLVSDKVIAYAVIAPDAAKGTPITITITTDKHKASFSTTLLTDILAGVFYDFPLTATVINSKTDLKVEEVVTPNPDPTPEEETANCYMINTVGEHDFCATQIGNGDKGIIPGAGFHVTSSKINPKSVKLMWQDVENFIDATSIRLENGRVHYKANKNTGNAMIAVYSGENCTGEILWSWHIWGVGDTMPEDEEVINRTGAKFMVMNRTLGTHSATSCNATLYQWGRKDPFPNSMSYYLDGKMQDISNSFPVLKHTQKLEATILSSVRNCNKIIDAYDTINDGDWIAEDNLLLWGDDVLGTHTSAGWNNVKTIYDPSPVGYRVANKATFTGFAKYENGRVDIKGDMGPGNIESKANVIVETFKEGSLTRCRPKYANGYFFKKNDSDTEGSFYPMTGYRIGANGSLRQLDHEGYITFYFTSAPSTSHDASSLLISPWWWTKGSSSGGGNHGSYNVKDYKDKWMVGAIRCVKE